MSKLVRDTHPVPWTVGGSSQDFATLVDANNHRVCKIHRCKFEMPPKELAEAICAAVNAAWKKRRKPTPH